MTLNRQQIIKELEAGRTVILGNRQIKKIEDIPCDDTLEALTIAGKAQIIEKDQISLFPSEKELTPININISNSLGDSIKEKPPNYYWIVFSVLVLLLGFYLVNLFTRVGQVKPPQIIVKPEVAQPFVEIKQKFNRTYTFSINPVIERNKKIYELRIDFPDKLKDNYIAVLNIQNLSNENVPFKIVKEVRQPEYYIAYVKIKFKCQSAAQVIIYEP